LEGDPDNDRLKQDHGRNARSFCGLNGNQNMNILPDKVQTSDFSERVTVGVICGIFLEDKQQSAPDPVLFFSQGALNSGLDLEVLREDAPVSPFTPDF